MAAPLVALLLLFLSPVHAAFTATTCSDINLCVERSPTGSVCLYSNYTSASWACNNATFQTPLEAHLGQHYAIGYYNGAQYLGGWNYSIPAAIVSPIVVCMSGRVNMTSAQYLTLCALTAADNSWSGGGCAVNVVPANVLDGCYAGPVTSVTITSTTTSATPATGDQFGPTSGIGPITTIGGIPNVSHSTGVRRNLLKDIGYLIPIIMILIFMTI